MRNVVLILVVLLVSNYSYGQLDVNSKKFIATNKIAVFNYDSLPNYNDLFEDNAKPTLLSLQELKLTQKILLRFVENYNKVDAENEYNLYTQSHPGVKISKSSFLIDFKNKYAQQLVPITNNSNQKEVWVNCLYMPQFSKEDLKYLNWEHEIVTFEDGGRYFFNLKINLSTGTYYDTKVNGAE